MTIWYRSGSLTGPAEVDVRVVVPGEPVEAFTRIPVAEIVERLTASLLIRLVPEPAPAAAPPGPAVAGAGPAVPARRSKLSDLYLSGGTDAAPDVNDYLAAVEALADQPEVTIVAAPDLGGHLTAEANRRAVVTARLDTAASRLDRLALLDVPADQAGNTPAAADALAWATTMLPADPVQRRAGAVYYPGLLVQDPLGGLTAPLRAVSSSGHVAGVVSRLDRERGAFQVPANAVLDEAVDLAPALTEPEQLLSAAPARFIVQSTGNYLRSRPHACGNLAPRESHSFNFVSDPADATVNKLEIWYDGGDELAVRVDPPEHSDARAVRRGKRAELVVGGRVVGRVYHRTQKPNNGDNHIDALLRPAGYSGTWTVTLEARRVTNGRFDAWLKRDDACRGCRARFTRDASNRTWCTPGRWRGRRPWPAPATGPHSHPRRPAPRQQGGRSQGRSVMMARRAWPLCTDPGWRETAMITSRATPTHPGLV